MLFNVDQGFIIIKTNPKVPREAEEKRRGLECIPVKRKNQKKGGKAEKTCNRWAAWEE